MRGHAPERGSGPREARRRLRRRSAGVAQRAVRSAQASGVYDHTPRPSIWPFLTWILTRLIAFGVLLSAAAVLYDSASSAEFQVRSVHVTGNVLLSQGDIQRAAAVTGANVFWLDRRTVEARLRAIPLVERVVVTPVLPGAVEIQVSERQPAALWKSGEQGYLVDREGLILKQVDAPSVRGIPRIDDAEPRPLNPGQRVDPRIVAASDRLAELLPRAGIQADSFQWSADGGLEILLDGGRRVRFAGNADVEKQIGNLRAVQTYLAQTGQSAHLIDVRFGDRPYYQ